MFKIINKNILLVLVLLFSTSFWSQENITPQNGPTINLAPAQNGDSMDDPKRLRAIQLVNDVEENQHFMTKLSSVDSALMLPIGISKKIGAVRYTIAIDSMKFKPYGAFLDAYAAVEFPGSTSKLAFGANNILFNPEGVIGGQQAKLYLISTHTINVNSNIKLVLPGDGTSWVNWNCGGFDRIHIKGKFIFNEAKFQPDSAKTSDKNVTASFEFEGSNLHELICQVSITPFRITGLKNVSFEVINAIVDYSELANASNMVFPQGYSNPNLCGNQNSSDGESEITNEGFGNTNTPPCVNYNPQLWTGFYLQSLTVFLPPELNKSNNRSSITINNMLIDNMGFTGKILTNNVFSLSEGSMNGWGFSVEQIGLSFVCNNLTGGQLGGKIAVPIDEVKSLNYLAAVSKNPTTNDLDYLFSINPTNNINFDVFGATINLNNNSSITVERVNGKFKPTAILNGSIKFDTPKFNSGAGRLLFQDLTIVTDAPYITNGLFSLILSNAATLSFKGFALTLNNLTLGVTQGKPKLGASVGLNLSGGDAFDISVGTDISLVGKYEPSIGPGIGRLTMDHVTINGISLGISTTPFSLNGGISFMDNHPVYGDGFFGNITVSILGIVDPPIGAAIGFGKLPTYKYFYVDIMVPGPIPIPSTPLVITSMIGGITYHLKPNKSTEAEFIALTNSYASNVSLSNPMNYTPTNTVGLGIKLGVNIMVIEGSVKGSALLGVTFSPSGGVNVVNLKGNVQAMATGIPVNGNFDMNYDFPSHTFDALFAISATYYGFINGNGLLKIHSDPSNWHVCFGTPSQPLNVSLILIGGVNAYLMTGNNLETVNFANVPTGNRNSSNLTNGNAYCIGAWINASLGSANNSYGWDFFTVHPNFNFQLGFDGMIKDYGPNATCGNDAQPFGVNGKYLQASAYLKLVGSLSISGHLRMIGNCPQSYETHLLCCHDCGILSYSNCQTINTPCLVDENFGPVNILTFPSIESNLLLKMPKPTYFEGNLSASYDLLGKKQISVAFNYKYGNNCVTPN